MRTGIIVMSVILVLVVCFIVGYAWKKWSDDRRAEEEAAASRTNLDDAIDIIQQIDEVRAVQRELKAAFARRELDGGVQAALSHPLYLQAQAELEELHEELTLLI